jgi:iron complex outermembrane receptor protein
MLIQKLPYDLTASAMYFRAGPMRWRRNGDPIQPSERVDWRLAMAFKLGATRGEIAYTVQMANGGLQEGRQFARTADRLQWLSLQLGF